jgi:hypothetical protein
MMKIGNKSLKATENGLSSRKAVQLKEGFSKRLIAYAAAASAAGMATLAAQPIEAEIVYTPTNITINSGHSLFIDLNHDGMNDFEVYNTLVRTTTFYGIVTACPALGVSGDGNRGADIAKNGADFGQYFAARLSYGASIGPALRFARPAIVTREILSTTDACMFLSAGGNWLNRFHPSYGFLGFRFLIAGQTHYGWARLSVPLATTTATLHGYAYETVPNKTIKAGQTREMEDDGPQSENRPAPQPSLGLLATGSLGLDVWRKKDEASLAPS